MSSARRITTNDEPHTTVTARRTASARRADRGRVLPAWIHRVDWRGAPLTASIGALSDLPRRPASASPRRRPDPCTSAAPGPRSTTCSSRDGRKGRSSSRVEDTDVERSREELIGADPLGDGVARPRVRRGPLLPVRRYDLYRAAAEKLLAEGKAYRAFETPEELEAERKKADAAGRAYRYSGAGRSISPEESDRRARAGERHVVRLAMPAETIVVEDTDPGARRVPARRPRRFRPRALRRPSALPLLRLRRRRRDADHARASAATTTSPTRPSTWPSSGRSARHSRGLRTSA